MAPYRVRALGQDDAVPSLDELKRNLGVPGYRLEYCYVATADQGDEDDPAAPAERGGGGELVGFCGAFDLDSGGKASATPTFRRTSPSTSSGRRAPA